MNRQAARGSGRIALVLLAGASLAACATLAPKYPAGAGARGAAPSGPTGYKTGQPYQVGGVWYAPKDQPDYDRTGIASWYGDAFHLKPTADGEIFDMNAISAAHTTLPLPSTVEVTNLDNGRRLTVRVNDRGPFVGGRIIDLSHAAARELGYDRAGLAHVRVRYIGPAPLAGPQAGVRYAQAAPARVATAVRPADEEIFEDRTPDTGAEAEALAAPDPEEILPVAAPEPVTVSTLAPLPETRAAAYRIQAGAFSDEAQARKVAEQLAPAGVATVEPVERNGLTLYRVLLPGPADEAQAYALRDRVAVIGFTDARVIRPF
ncbi:septal ring lytic transglycosylase RlpA family protein [Phenylobacterium sp.]|uniref:septal ring lytic transglycosylase RlpA family protein n=1 Tax=Phenylobacterium sp. TaxID=1871053 RepID=UPI00286B60E2|nr:septal ring lytic transglycosylase RlpA family protein [Phenylobacterium sp.]